MVSSFRLQSEDLNTLYQYAFVLCQDHNQAQDLLQASIEILLRELQQKKDIKNPLQYVRTVIRNKFIDQYRQQVNLPHDSYEESSAYDISPIDLENWQIQQSILETIWQQLPPLDRDILYHWAVLGYSTDEACELLQLPRGTFLARIHRLRKKYQALNPMQHQNASSATTKPASDSNTKGGSL